MPTTNGLSMINILFLALVCHHSQYQETFFIMLNISNNFYYLFSIDFELKKLSRVCPKHYFKALSSSMILSCVCQYSKFKWINRKYNKRIQLKECRGALLLSKESPNNSDVYMRNQFYGIATGSDDKNVLNRTFYSWCTLDKKTDFAVIQSFIFFR